MEYYLKHKSRLWEIDFLRGIAIIAMVIFNSASLFSFFGIINTGIDNTLWATAAIVIASTFILLSGVSMTLSFKKRKDYTYNILRGAQVLFYGFIVTIVSWFVAGSYAIVFGILHLIGVGKIISSLSVKFEKLNIIFGLAIIAIGIAMQNAISTNPLLVWLGIRYLGFQTLDYFPLFPWLGVMLIGVALGNMLFPKGKRMIKVEQKPGTLVNFLCIIGRYSLLIYFIHVVIVLGIVFLIHQVI